MNIFLNLTQHELLPSQIEKIKEMSCEIIDFRQILDKNLVNNLLNSPDNYQDLNQIAKQLFSDLIEHYNRVKEVGKLLEGEKYYVHMPIGSPCFQFLFARYLGTLPYYYYDCFTLVLSHSERIVTEKIIDGKAKKEVSFVFSHFIEV